MDRRNFLTALSALGFFHGLPMHLSQASPAQVDEAWQHALAGPMLFAVDPSGIIVDPSASDPVRRSDVYGFDVRDFRDPAAIIDLAERTTFGRLLQELAEHWCDEAEGRLSQPTSIVGDGGLRDLVHAMRDDWDAGWQQWVEQEDMASVERIKAAYKDWLAEDLDGDDAECMPPGSGSAGSAWGFFVLFDHQDLSKIGVQVIDSDHPGSNCRYAKLVSDFDRANLAAAEMGHPYRFRQE